MTHSELLEASYKLPVAWWEYRSVPPDGASLDGSLATFGLPLESARRPDVEVEVSEREIKALFAEAYRITARAAILPRISTTGLHLIESFEGFSPTVYLDSVGVRTIGYGTTAADISPLPTRCTRIEAEGWLAHQIAVKYAPAVHSLGVALNRHQFDALCSFAYNLGPGSMSSGWTIGRLLRAGEYRQAADALLMYDRAGGVVLLGLKRRREAERALFLEPTPKLSDPHHYSRFIDAKLIDGFNERWTVREFDRLLDHRGKAENQFRALQDGIVKLRKRDWAVAHQDAPPVTWALAWRGWRWQELERRSKVKL